MPKGFDYTIGGNTGVNSYRQYIALPGRQTKAGRFSIPTLASTKVVTGVGFQPDALIIFGTLMATGEPNDFNDFGVLHVGASDGSNEWGGAVFYNHLTGGLLRTSTWRNDKIISVMWQSAEIIQAEIASFDADGFTLNVTIPMAAAGDFFYFAMKGGGGYHCGTALCPTSTGTQAITGLGFEPSAIYFVSTQRPYLGPTVGPADIDTYGRIILGGADADSQHIVWGGSTTNDVYNDSLSRSGVAISMNEDAQGAGPYFPTATNEANVSSFDTDGFTLNWTTTDGTARYFSWIAFENGEEGRWTYNNNLNTPVTTSKCSTGFIFFMTDDRGVESIDHNTGTYGNSVAMGVCDMNEDQFLAGYSDLDTPPFSQAQSVRSMMDGVAFGAYERRTDGSLGTMPNHPRDRGTVFILCKKPQIIRYR